MWRSKKALLIALLVPAVLVGSIGGVAFAQGGDVDESQPKPLLARVADKLGIDQQALEDAFAEAQNEMRTEALENRLQGLVDEEVITQEEAGQYRDWWQSKPDIELPRPPRFGPGPHGPGEARGMCRLHGWGGPSAPAE